MDTGLLIMYIFVAIIIVGSLVYSRLEDKKGKQYGYWIVKYVCRSYAFRLRNDSVFQN